MIMPNAKSISIFLLRVLALGATVSATIVMVTSHDSAEVLNVTFKAKYTNTPAFKYFVGINVIVSCYGLVVMLLPSKKVLWRLVLVLDLVALLLLDSGISAALAIAQVGKKGNSHAGWLPICDQFPKFCDHVAGALISGFAAAILYIVLFLLSVHRVINLPTIKA